MINLLSPLHKFTRNILSTAQPKWDGGIMGFMLKNVLFVNSTEKAPQDHVVNTILHGGYLAGLVCGMIWALLLFFIGLGLCICHSRRKSDSKTSMMYVMIAHQIQFKRGRMGQSGLCKAVQFSLSIVFTIIAFVMCILAFVVNAHLNSAMTSVRNQDAVIPSIARSVKNVHDYVKLLAPHARIATEPIVEEIVYKTELLQNNTKAVFTKVLTKEMGGDILQDNGVKLVDYMTVAYNSFKTLDRSQKELTSKPLKRHLRELYTSLKRACKPLNDISDKTISIESLESVCEGIAKHIKDATAFDVDTVKVDSSLVSMLNRFDKAPANMKREMDVTLQKKQAIEDRLFIESKELLKVGQTIRNMTRKQWDDLEIKLEAASGMFENITDLIYGDARNKVVKYEGLRNAVYLIVLFIMMTMCIICSVVFIYHFSIAEGFTRRIRNTCKIVLYISMMILSFVIIICMCTFLLGGYSETEVCRYLDEKPVANRNTSNMHLDKMINKWINKHWSKIEELAGDDSSMPVPRPRDIFYGIQTTCRQNKSIMLAINGIESMDMSAVSKPEMTARFLRLGRQLMHKSFRNTNPDDLLRPNMKTEMFQLNDTVQKFIYNENYTRFIQLLGKPVLSINLATLSKSLNSFARDIRLQTTSDKSIAEALRNTELDLHVAKIRVQEIQKLVTEYKKEMHTQKVALVNLRNHMNISNLINEMVPAIGVIKKYIYNVTYWIERADELYDKIIVEGTKQNSPKLMAESTEKIMGVLGPCRHIFNAYNIMVFTSCNVIIQSINLLWFFIGCSVIFLTPSIIMALLVLTKEMGLPSNGANGSKNPYDHDNQEEKKLQLEKYEMNDTVDITDVKTAL